MYYDSMSGVGGATSRVQMVWCLMITVRHMQLIPCRQHSLDGVRWHVIERADWPDAATQTGLKVSHCWCRGSPKVMARGIDNPAQLKYSKWLKYLPPRSWTLDSSADASPVATRCVTRTQLTQPASSQPNPASAELSTSMHRRRMVIVVSTSGVLNYSSL